MSAIFWSTSLRFLLTLGLVFIIVLASFFFVWHAISLWQRSGPGLWRATYFLERYNNPFNLFDNHSRSPPYLFLYGSTYRPFSTLIIESDLQTHCSLRPIAQLLPSAFQLLLYVYSSPPFQLQCHVCDPRLFCTSPLWDPSFQEC